MIVLNKIGKKDKDLVKVTLSKVKDFPGYKKGSNLIADNDGGLLLLVDPKEYKAFAKAGRTLANFGVSQAKVYVDKELKVKHKDYFAFVNGMFDLKTPLTLHFDLDAEEIKELATEVNLHAQYRMIANSSAKDSTPLSLADELISMLEESCEVCKLGEIYASRIVRGDEQFLQFKGLQAVGLASENDPVMAIIDFVPNGKKEGEGINLALVGKGITFDSGGYNLKPGNYMNTMRTDKSGAVYLAGALDFAIRNGLNKYVRLYLCLTENMVGSKGMLPGDIIDFADGTSVEITNTDAEGRLVLADALIHASQSKIKTIIDAATLTGAAKVALGRNMIAVFARGNKLPEAFAEAFDYYDEDYWLMPMRDYHKAMLKSDRADLQNSTSGDGIPGASTAALFLDHFVDKKADFIHLDLASAYCVSSSPYFAKGSTGESILSLARLIKKIC